jgi:hypothetical protein
MKTYQETRDGDLMVANTIISKGHGWYRIALEEAAAKPPTAKILKYVAREITVSQSIAALENTVTKRNLRLAAIGDEYAIKAIKSIESQIQELRTSDN